ncbi:ABC transporter permease subunit [Laceyella tengchongensis]|uniref:ABC transporter permease subunit n=1 Tax=Laceyella tengchongensis TaxID=574699 RepID=UPI0018902C7A
MIRRWSSSFFAVLALVFLLALCPLLPFGEIAEPTEQIHSVSQAIRSVADYFAGISSGESFMYNRLHNLELVHENFLQAVWPLFWYSCAYVGGAGVIALFLGIWVGVRFASSTGWLKEVVGFCNVVPDLMMAMTLQLLVIWVYKRTGVLLANVMTIEQEEAVLLPILVLFILPFVYVVRLVSHLTYAELSKEYVLLAKAKGIPRSAILNRHVLRNVLPQVRAHLPQLVSAMIGSMIVVEQWMNVNGVGWFILHKFEITPLLTYPVLVNSLFLLVILFMCLYGLMRLAFSLIVRGVAHD